MSNDQNAQKDEDSLAPGNQTPGTATSVETDANQLI